MHGGTGAPVVQDDTGGMKHGALGASLSLAIALATMAAAAPTPPRGDRASFAQAWQAQGLQPAKSNLDLLYLRPMAADGGSAAAVQVAPVVQVEMRDNWQRANR